MCASFLDSSDQSSDFPVSGGTGEFLGEKSEGSGGKGGKSEGSGGREREREREGGGGCALLSHFLPILLIPLPATHPSFNPFLSWNQDNTHKLQPRPHPLARCATVAEAQVAESHTVTSRPEPRTYPGSRSRSTNKAPGLFSNTFQRAPVSP